MRQFFISKFNEQGEEALKTICNLSLAQTLFMSKYKELPPIETLTPEAKLDMKKYVHAMFPGKTVEFKLQAAKIIYTIGTLL